MHPHTNGGNKRELLCFSCITRILVQFARDIHLDWELVSQQNTPHFTSFIAFDCLLNLY